MLATPARAAAVALAVCLWSFALVAHAGSEAPPRSDLEAPPRTPEGRLVDARVAYERGDYAIAVSTLVPLLYPSIALSTEDGVIEAHRLLALAYILEKKQSEAEEEASSILALRPSFQLDPIVDPPTAIAFFESVRRRQGDRLREARDRERKETEAKARAAEEQRREAAARVYTQPRIERRSRLVATIPFGVGQWQNGQNGKAAAFATSEVVLGALSLGGYLAISEKYPQHLYPIADKGTAQALVGLQLGAGIAFWATLVWGVIDAHVLFKRPSEPKRSTPPLSLVPSIAPGLVGLGAQGAF